MGFNSGFKGLNHSSMQQYVKTHTAQNYTTKKDATER